MVIAPPVFLSEEEALQVIKAEVPLAEMLSYDAELTSMTGGRGSYHMEMDHYDEVPAHLQEKIIAAARAEMVNSAGSIWGLMPYSFKVADVMGPMAATAAWTASFDIYAAGWSFLLLAVFYLVVDVWRLRKWTFFFRVVGLNSITIYLGSRVVDFEATSRFLFGGLDRVAAGGSGLVVLAGVIGVEWLALLFLYRQKVFLRV